MLSYMCLQVPLVATIMLNGLAQVLAPAVSFMIDTQPHCPRLYQEPLVPFIIFVVCTVGIMWALYPAGFGGSLLRQRQLPFRFRVQLLAYMAAFANYLHESPQEMPCKPPSASQAQDFIRFFCANLYRQTWEQWATWTTVF